jgi:hypothetical protein
MSMPPMPFEYKGRPRGALLWPHLQRGSQIRPRADRGQRSARVRRLPARVHWRQPRSGLVRPHAQG